MFIYSYIAYLWNCTVVVTRVLEIVTPGCWKLAADGCCYLRWNPQTLETLETVMEVSQNGFSPKIIQTFIGFFFHVFPFFEPSSEPAFLFECGYPHLWNPSLLGGSYHLVSGVITPVISGLSVLIPFVTGVITHLRFVVWATKYPKSFRRLRSSTQNNQRTGGMMPGACCKIPWPAKTPAWWSAMLAVVGEVGGGWTG